jgi:hypothetical protein
MNKMLIAAAILLAAISATAQKTNEAVIAQLKTLRAEKAITLSYDAKSNTTKLMVVAGNFDDKEAARAGIMAMNFGMAVFYPGKSIVIAPVGFDLSFWVMTKKPQFASSNKWTAQLSKETLDFGEARYGAKSSEKMEYLNFKITRDDLGKIAAENNVKIRLGGANFTFTAEQLKIFKNLLAVTDSR